MDAILEKYVPEAELSEVRRVMYGWNQGKPVQSLEISNAATELAKANDFDLQAYKFGAAAEQLRRPRVVKVSRKPIKVFLSASQYISMLF